MGKEKPTWEPTVQKDSLTAWKPPLTDQIADTTLEKVNTVVQTQTQKSTQTLVKKEQEEQLIMKMILKKPHQNGALLKWKTVTSSEDPTPNNQKPTGPCAVNWTTNSVWVRPQDPVLVETKRHTIVSPMFHH